MTSRNRGFVKKPGANSQGNLKFGPKWRFFGPGRSWRPLILHVLGPRWRLGSPALRLPPQASQGPTAPTQPRTCTYMYIAWHARYDGMAAHLNRAVHRRSALRRAAMRGVSPALPRARLLLASACLLLARDRYQFAGLYGTTCAVHVLCMCCACVVHVLCYAVLCCAVHVLCSACACASAVHALCMCYVCAVISCVCAVLCCAVLCMVCAAHALFICVCYARAACVPGACACAMHVLCTCQCLHQRELLANDT